MATDIARLGLYVDSSGVVRATKELRNLEGQGQKTERTTTNATAKITANLKKVGKAGALAAVAFAAFTATQAVSDIKEFNRSLSDLSAITGATGKDLAFYAENAKEIGRTTSLSASQAAKAFKLIASAKPDLLQSSKALNQVTRDAVTLAEATGMELPAAAEALGGALNQFQLDASKSADVINILAASAQLGTAEVANVTEALRNAGPAANSLGIDLAETVAGIQALAKAGRQGADAGTGLRQVMLKLEKTADSKLQPSIVGLNGALQELASRNLDNNQLMKIFGEEGFSAATALLSTRDTVDKLNTSLRGTQTAFEQAATRMDDLQGDTDELKSAMEGLSISLGEKLEPNLRKATQGLTGFINKITELVTGKASVSSLTKELEILEDRLASSKFFGRSAKAQKSALRSEIEGLRQELKLAKAEAGETAAIADILAQKREQLANLEAKKGSKRNRIGKNSPVGVLRQEIKDLEDQLRSAAPIVEEVKAAITEDAKGSGNSGLSDAAQKAKDSIRSLQESLAEQIITIKGGDEAALEYRLTLGDLSDEVKLLGVDGEKLAASIIKQSKELASLNRETKEYDALVKKMRENAAKDESFLADIENLKESLLKNEDLEMLHHEKTLEMIREYAKRGLDEQKEAWSLAEQENARHQEAMATIAEDRSKKATDNMTEFVKKAAENMQDAMGDFFFDAMQGEFDNLADSFKRTIDRMVAELLASQLLDFLKKTAVDGGFGDAVASIAGSAFGGARAEGGPVTGGTPYLVGERGPELIVPKSSGTVIPNNKLAGSNSVVVNINVSGIQDTGGLQRTAAQIAQQSGLAAQRALARNG